MLYPHSSLSERAVEARVRQMSVEDRIAAIEAYVGNRANRRHRPGRAFERTDYRFDVLSDYGAFRDLQRHRMLTIDWRGPLAPPWLCAARSGGSSRCDRRVRCGDGSIRRAA